MVTVQPIPNNGNVENSYDHDQGTKLISELSPSPDAHEKLLNVYYVAYVYVAKRIANSYKFLG